jgi:hypothetical protein
VHALSYDDVAPYIAIIDGNDRPEEILEGLRFDAEENGQFQLVIYDTFQAGFAISSNGEFNDNAGALRFLLRLRPLKDLPGQPSVIILFHPVKNAGKDDLVPYGAGSLINELDGNFTLWSAAPFQIEFHQNKVRGPEFEPCYFRIDKLSSDAIVDIGGRGILLPVLMTTTEDIVEQRGQAAENKKAELLRAIAGNPKDSVSKWMATVGIKSRRALYAMLKELENEKLITQVLGKWSLTSKGEKCC